MRRESGSSLFLWLALALGGGLAAWGFYAMEKQTKETFAGSKYFKPEEFGVKGWLVKPELLRALDAFRGFLGVPVRISPVAGAVIREAVAGDTGTSQHLTGRAADVLWPVRKGVKIPALELEEAARAAGVTGLGFYRWGVHLDVRPDRTPQAPATWARLDSGRYTTVAEWKLSEGVALGVV